LARTQTQYGNILRVRPDDQKSPLLQPANEHKQLVVIDFEYAAANLPGLEFANHFSEWTYNYHDPLHPFACDVSKYPTVEEQTRFVRAYVDHHSHKFNSKQPPHPYGEQQSTTTTKDGSAAPAPAPAASTSSIVEFMLVARVQPAGGWREEEKRREEGVQERVGGLMEETRVWRAANSAQWVAWGVMQAKIPGLDKYGDGVTVEGEGTGSSGGEEGEEGQQQVEGEGEGEGEGKGDEFDYLGYAQERAFFFLGDCVLMGLVRLEELGEEVRERIKLVEY
jgi:choline kinase